MTSKAPTVFLKKPIYVQANRKERVNGKRNGVPGGRPDGSAVVQSSSWMLGSGGAGAPGTGGRELGARELQGALGETQG